MDEVEEWISEVEEKAMKITWMEKESFYGGDILRGLWDNMKWKNIALYCSQKEKREKKLEKLFEEIMAENFLNMGNETDIQIQEAHRTPNKMNSMRTRSKHIKN